MVLKRPGRTLLAVVVLGVLIVAALSPVLESGFLAYDDVYISENPLVQSGLTARALRWDVTTFLGGNWVPLTWLSHQIDWSFFGGNPRGHHLTSLLIHTANCLLLFILLLRLTAAYWKSAFVAALFGIHPLHVESVAWISERKDVLCAFFWLLSLLAYHRYVARPAPRRYGILFVFCALSLMAKPMAVSLPFVLLLLDFWPLARSRIASEDGSKVGFRSSLYTWGLLATEKAPLFLLTAASSCVTLWAQRSAGATEFGESIPLTARCLNACISYDAYLWQTFWPTRLAVFYPHPRVSSAIAALASLLLILLVTAAAFYWRRRQPFLLTGWLWYLGMLIPVLGLVQVGLQARADRYSYLPLIGIFLILAWGGGIAASSWKKSMGITATFVLVALGILTFRQAGYWRDGITLFSHTLAVTEGNFLAHNNLGSALLQAGRTKEAKAQFEAALLLRPHLFNARASMGLILLEEGKPREAIAHFQALLEIRPRDFRIHNNLGNAYIQLGRIDDAISHFRAAVVLAPGNPQVLANLSQTEALRRRTTVSPDSLNSGNPFRSLSSEKR